MLVHRAIKERRSIRHFRERSPIEKEHVKKIIEAGHWAPSAKNLQTTEYIVVTDEERKKKLAEIARQDQPLRAPLSIVLVGDMKRAAFCEQVSQHDTTTAERGIKMFMYLNAGAAAQNMLLTAHELGLGSLWISSFDDEEMTELLDLPAHYKPMAILCFGKPAYEQVEAPLKRDINEVLHHDRWTPKQHDPKVVEHCKNINTPEYRTIPKKR